MFIGAWGIGVAYMQSPLARTGANANEAIHHLSDTGKPVGQNVGSLSYRICQLILEKQAASSPLGKLFPDTKENHWVYGDLSKLKAWGLMPGIPAENYTGMRLYSRGEIAAKAYYAYLTLQDDPGLETQPRVCSEYVMRLRRDFSAFHCELDSFGFDSTKALATLKEALPNEQDELQE